MINHSKYSFGTSTRLALYNSLIRPYFEYCIAIWGNSKLELMAKLQRMQKRVVRMIAGVQYLHPTKQLFEDLCIPKIKDLYTKNILILAHRIYHDKVPLGVTEHFKKANETQTRTENKLLIPNIVKLKLRRLPKYTIPSVWNNSRNEFRSAENETSLKRMIILASKLWTHKA